MVDANAEQLLSELENRLASTERKMRRLLAQVTELRQCADRILREPWFPDKKTSDT